MKSILFLILAFLFSSSNVFSQNEDSAIVKTNYRKRNIIKANLSSMVLYNPGIVLSYERILNNSKSFGFSAGYVQTPLFFDFDASEITMRDDVKKFGYMASAEYRFYLKNENKYNAPRGIYIGPFVNCFNYKTERGVFLNNNPSSSDLVLKTNFAILNVGGQLGYQFIFANRIALDLVLFGPALTWYHMDVKLEGNASEADLTENQQKILEHVIEKIPVVGKMVNGEKLSESGRADFLALGFRYAFQIGYYF